MKVMKVYERKADWTQSNEYERSRAKDNAKMEDLYDDFVGNTSVSIV